jgi:hypothetical protein
VRVKKPVKRPKATLSQIENRLVDRKARDRKDLEIIEQNAERLNRDALDTAEYQHFLR